MGKAEYVQRLREMFSTLILIAATVGLMQFGISYWRSLIAGIAAQPLSDRFHVASALDHQVPQAEDFGALLSFHRMTPGIERRTSSLRGIQIYYGIVGALRGLPALRQWAQSEMTTCARYVAVLVDQRLEQNFACAAEMRSN
jgi:hypothetical protein